MKNLLKYILLCILALAFYDGDKDDSSSGESNLMSSGLQKAAGDRLRGLLSTMTSSPFKGVLTGLGVTTVIQSSSATTVMVVSFVNAGLLTLTQAIGVIMGANIGTTVTGWTTTDNEIDQMISYIRQ